MMCLRGRGWGREEEQEERRGMGRAERGEGRRGGMAINLVI